MTIQEAIKANETKNVIRCDEKDRESYYEPMCMQGNNFTTDDVLADWEIVREPEVVEFECGFAIHYQPDCAPIVFPVIEKLIEDKLKKGRWKIVATEVMGDK